jgi:hypothetical protein
VASGAVVAPEVVAAVAVAQQPVAERNVAAEVAEQRPVVVADVAVAVVVEQEAIRLCLDGPTARSC